MTMITVSSATSESRQTRFAILQALRARRREFFIYYGLVRFVRVMEI